MEMATDRVDVEEIMREIREQIRNESANGLDLERMMSEIHAEVDSAAHPPIPSFEAVRGVPHSAVSVDGSRRTAASSAGVQNVNPNSRLSDDAFKIPYAQLIDEVRYLKEHYYISYYWEMGKGPKGFLKRVIRKLGKFLALPIRENQNEYNLHSANAVDTLRAVAESQDGAIEGVLNMIEGMRGTIESMRDVIEGQWSAIELLQEQVDALEKRDREDS